MKKIALLFALVAFAPLANATAAETGSFDFWAWVESLFEAESDASSTAIQDESRSFNSIIR